MVEFDGSLLIRGWDGASSGIWRSDGTTAGTSLVVGMFTGVEVAVVGGAVVFNGEDTVHGRELWRSDGTPAGTTLVADLKPGAASSFTRGYLASGDHVFFIADAPSPASRMLWAYQP
jgi:ELWxxDGT repeat protein